MSDERFARLAEPMRAPDLRLVPLGFEHEAELGRAFADADLWTWMLVRRPVGPADVHAWVVDAVARADAREHVPFVAIAPDGSLAATSRFLGLRYADDALEIGWTLVFAAARGRYVNSRMKSMMLARAFDAGFARVELRTDARNARSRAAIAAIGGTYEGTLRAYQRRADGTSRDSAIFSVLDSEWPEVRARLDARIEARREARPFERRIERT